MVVTRSGVRVQSPTKTESDQASGVQATPSTAWRTRRTAADPLAQRAPGETSSELHRNEGELAACCPTSTIKRCTRVTRLHSPAQPSTPVESTHEADVSDLESCCSVVSDMEPLVTRAKGRKRRPRTADQEEEEMSDAESCSSAVSASKTGLSVRRSTRKKRLPESSEPAPVEKEDVNVDQVLETKSCSVVVSDMELLVNRARGLQRRPRTADQEEEEMSDAESCSSAVSASKTGLSVRRSTRKKRLPESSEPAPVEKEDVNVGQVLETESCSAVSEKVTRNQKKAACTRVRVESEASDADSCHSSVSGASASKSVRRRATRSTRQTCPLPIYLDEASESSQSPALTGRRTRAARGKPAAGVDASEPQSCDSEGFESGPIYSVAKAQSAAPNATDSDLTGLHSPNGSPCSTPGRGTGSGNSRQDTRASRRSLKNHSMVVEADDSLDESRLDSTLINEDADCTMLADEPGVSVIPEEGSHVSDGETAETTEDQRVELSTEHKNGAASEVEMAQETIPSPELIKPCPSIIVAVCDTASDVTNEKDEVVDVTHVETHSSLGVMAVDDDAAGETQSSEVERTEVSTQETDDQRVDASCEAQAESILVTSKQQHEITVNSDPDNEPTDITVQKAKVISLLDSSDDEDSRYDEEEEKDGSEEDDLEGREEERGGPSKKPESAGVSVDGLFMIDTRPGEDADEDYYKDRPTEQREQAAKQAEQEAHDEEFIDEEGDDEDDEDTEILFSSRDLQAKELSSRIDPGLKLKALGGLYINFDGSKSKPVSSSLLKLKEKKIQDEVMKKSVIGPDFEKKDAVPPYRESKQALKLKHREERAKSTGEGWFNMKAPELTHELKGDLQVLKMRGSMDPKRFYKKNDRDGFPKYFQIGTVVDSPVDFYHSRIPKKQRKRTMVEELLADAEFRHNNKKKFQHIVMENAAQAAGKKNKKKKFKKN